MTILDKIVAYKKVEVAKRKSNKSISDLEKSASFSVKQPFIKDALIAKGSSGIIAEFKKKSPSKGIINAKASVEEVTKGYQEAGAAAVSVLTDENFFGGHDNDLIAARKANPTLPILRKEFIIDEYQILEAKSIGASAILLIASVLEKKQAKELASFAKSLDLDILMEIHTKEELDIVNEHLDMVGVNNRNLNTFEVDIKTSVDLFPLIPNDFVKISESGISNTRSILELKEVGFQGFLIGENFMKTENPQQSCKEFIEEIMSK